MSANWLTKLPSPMDEEVTCLEEKGSSGGKGTPKERGGGSEVSGGGAESTGGGEAMRGGMEEEAGGGGVGGISGGACR